MKTRMRLALLLSVLGGFFLVGCDREGPMEETGEQLDRSMEQTQEQIERGGEQAGEAMEGAGERMQE